MINDLYVKARQDTKAYSYLLKILKYYFSKNLDL